MFVEKCRLHAWLDMRTFVLKYFRCLLLFQRLTLHCLQLFWNEILLLHPDLDSSGGVPGDEVVAGDDLVGTIPVLSDVVALSHHAFSPVTVLIVLRHWYLFAFGLFSATNTEELWPGLVVSSCVQASLAGCVVRGRWWWWWLAGTCYCPAAGSEC